MKSNKKIFWTVYWIIMAVGLVVVTSVLIVLHAFLISYESAQPTHKMDEVFALFENNQLEEILNYETTTYDKQYRADVELGLSERLAGKKLTYTIKYGEYSDNAPAYTVYADSDPIAAVYLVADEKRGSFNSKKWNLEKITGLVTQYDDIDIVAPSNYTVKLNGAELQAEPTEVAEINEKEQYDGYVENFPTQNTYHVTNIYRQPEVTCFTPSGEEVALASDEENVYTFAMSHNGTLSDDGKAELTDFVERYTKYCMNELTFNSVEDEFVEGTETYRRMKLVSEVSEYSGRHDNMTFSDIEVTDYVVYNENAYKLTVEYTYTLYLNDRQRDNPTILNIYYGKIDGEWKILQMYVNRG